jgi:hypothetical protein
MNPRSTVGRYVVIWRSLCLPSGWRVALQGTDDSSAYGIVQKRNTTMWFCTGQLQKFIPEQHDVQYTSLVGTSSSAAYKAEPKEQFCEDFGPNGNCLNYLKQKFPNKCDTKPHNSVFVGPQIMKCITSSNSNNIHSNNWMAIS